jgi:hypothetical protein
MNSRFFGRSVRWLSLSENNNYRPTTRQKNQFQDDGFIIIPSLISSKMVINLQKRLEPMVRFPIFRGVTISVLRGV